jgi:tRNA(Glu) U13 pseudouridine synthase TruD
MYVLKEEPQDFIVKEKLKYTLSEQGNYVLYLLKKTNRDTMNLFQHLAHTLHIKEKEIGYCGIKDKHAVTEQYITLPKDHRVLPDIDHCSLEYIGAVDNSLHFGDLQGNAFEITIRNLDTEQELSINNVPNYFGEQRFSTQNAKLGKSLVNGDFPQVLELLKNDKQYAEKIEEQLAKEPTNKLKAIQVVPRNVLKFYIHAYQSFLWNIVANQLAIQKARQQEVPLIGFGSELGEVEDHYEDLMADEGITQRDFIMRQYPELSSEGSSRSLYMDVSDFSCAYADDERHHGKKKCIAKFTLGKGSYATVLIAHWFAKKI